jgi:hypothetical protein
MGELKTLLINKCGSTEITESLATKLKEAKQGGKTVENFAAELENVAEKMAALEITASNAVNQETKKKLFVTCALATRWWHSRMEFTKA